MRKTANTVNIGDMLYMPTIEDVVQFQIANIEKSNRGIKMGSSGCHGIDLDDSIFNAAIAIEVKFKSTYRKGPFYLNIEDAQAKQYELRCLELTSMQRKAEKALSDLNSFTIKYFLPK